MKQRLIYPKTKNFILLLICQILFGCVFYKIKHNIALEYTGSNLHYKKIVYRSFHNDSVFLDLTFMVFNIDKDVILEADTFKIKKYTWYWLFDGKYEPLFSKTLFRHKIPTKIHFNYNDKREFLEYLPVKTIIWRKKKVYVYDIFLNRVEQIIKKDGIISSVRYRREKLYSTYFHPNIGFVRKFHIGEGEIGLEGEEFFDEYLK